MLQLYYWNINHFRQIDLDIYTLIIYTCIWSTMPEKYAGMYLCVSGINFHCLWFRYLMLELFQYCGILMLELFQYCGILMLELFQYCGILMLELFQYCGIFMFHFISSRHWIIIKITYSIIRITYSRKMKKRTCNVTVKNKLNDRQHIYIKVLVQWLSMKNNRGIQPPDR